MEEDDYAFVNNFWGLHSAPGFEALTGRDRTAQRTLDDLRVIYRERASIEEDYAKRLAKLARVSLGKDESGTARDALDVVKAELMAVSQGHSDLAGMMRSQLEGAVAGFIGKTRDGRREAYLRIERLHKTKIAQEGFFLKAKEKLDTENGKAMGYGNDRYGNEDRNRMKHERAQSTVQLAERDVQNCHRALEETTSRWIEEWKLFCDDFQDFEEERLTFLKANLWDYANVVSTLCVADDESCERIRVSLEACDVDQNVMHFVKTFASGSEIPDAPHYVANASPDRRSRPQFVLAKFARQSNRQMKRRKSTASAHASSAQRPGPKASLSDLVERGSASLAPAQQSPNRNRQQGYTATPTKNGSVGQFEQINSRSPPQRSAADFADTRLNIGQNMLPVDQSVLRDQSVVSPVKNGDQKADPIAAALADLRRKGSQKSLTSRKSFNRGSMHIDPDTLGDNFASHQKSQTYNPSQSALTASNLGQSPHRAQDRPVSRNSFRSAVSSNSRQAERYDGLSGGAASPSKLNGGVAGQGRMGGSPLGIKLDASGNVMQDDLADEYMERVRRQQTPQRANVVGGANAIEEQIATTQTRHGNESGYRGEPSRTPSPLPPQPPQRQGTGEVLNGRQILFYVKALYDYDATIDEEFSFRTGDIIGVTETEEDGWWQGELVGARTRIGGTFPSNFSAHLD